MKKITYKSSGVDIAKASSFKQQIKSILEKSHGPYVLKDLGSFGNLFKIPKEKYEAPVLVSSTDGVGTKLKIAQLVDTHDTVGIDLVAMNVNDILCLGAQPLFFLDYIACGKLNQSVLLEIAKGISKGCIEAACSLIGGETAEMPGMYREGEYDLAGFCVGVVEERQIINGSNIKVGDAIVGLESNGFHSNGFSLVRKVFSKTEMKRYAKELLKPTRIYVKPILSLLGAMSQEPRAIKGIAHITGGSFYNKVAKILPPYLNANIDKRSWVVPEVFRLVQSKGNIEEGEMYHTFNMGVGMVVVLDRQYAAEAIKRLATFKIKAWIIGDVVKGKKEVVLD